MKFYLPTKAVFWWSCVLLLHVSLRAHADVMPPQMGRAEERLRENPDTYDRVDNYCKGKKPKAVCLIAGSTFAGGGEGTCVNRIRGDGNIDLTCERSEKAWIERKLPEGGFVADHDLCMGRHGKLEGTEYNCTPLDPSPSDQFCTGRRVGGACTVVLTYKGKTEKHAGICRNVTETESFYHWGHREATREVIRCEPPSIPQRTFEPVSWAQKLIP